MTSPICKVNGAATTNGVDLTPASTATIALADTAGVKQWSILAVSTDELTTAAAINGTLTINSITKTATFTVPAAGSGVIFESVVNNGLDVNWRRDASLTTRFAIFTLATSGARVCAFNETIEGSISFGWITKINPLLRSSASKSYVDSKFLTLGAFTQPALAGTVSGVAFSGPALPVGTSVIVVAGTTLVGFYRVASVGATIGLTLDSFDTIVPTNSVAAGAVVYVGVNQAANILFGGSINWDGSPGDVSTALNSLAAAVAGLLGGPVPV